MTSILHLKTTNIWLRPKPNLAWPVPSPCTNPTKSETSVSQYRKPLKTKIELKDRLESYILASKHFSKKIKQKEPKEPKSFLSILKSHPNTSQWDWIAHMRLRCETGEECVFEPSPFFPPSARPSMLWLQSLSVTWDGRVFSGTQVTATEGYPYII